LRTATIDVCSPVPFGQCFAAVGDVVGRLIAKCQHIIEKHLGTEVTMAKKNLLQIVRFQL
jgi:hypothetical protein